MSAGLEQRITGFILAGGKSERLGTDKALMKINGRTAIELAVEMMESVFARNYICTHQQEELGFLGLPLIADRYQQAGPLAGLHAALSRSETEDNFFISCDMPLMSRELIASLAGWQTDKAIVVCALAGRLQPLPGLYRKSLLPLLAKMLDQASKQGKGKGPSFHALMDQAQAEIIDPSDLPFHRDELFFNMNRMEDYQQVIQITAMEHKWIPSRDANF
jgi:molybdenum cofactor guanylyltransferase